MNDIEGFQRRLGNETCVCADPGRPLINQSNLLDNMARDMLIRWQLGLISSVGNWGAISSWPVFLYVGFPYHFLLSGLCWRWHGSVVKLTRQVCGEGGLFLLLSRVCFDAVRSLTPKKVICWQSNQSRYLQSVNPPTALRNDCIIYVMIPHTQ